jgi:hypothetical protein
MGHAICLQRWRTVTGNSNTVIQDEADWVDVGAAKDVAFYFDVAFAHTTVHTLLQVQTSPTKDESYFAGSLTTSHPYIAQVDVFGATLGLQPIQVVRFATTTTSAPLSRFLRWVVNFATTNDELTFRIWMNVNARGR